MKKLIVILMLFAFSISCGGRAANPVMIQQYGDENRTCQALEREMVFIQGEIQQLMPKTKKTGKNVALGIAGWFLIVPWFFMDLSKAEQEEINAYRQRYNHLLIISGDKKCGINKEPIPDFQKKPAEKSENSDIES